MLSLLNVGPQVRLNRLAARALIEPVTEEPWPWQEAISHACGAQERYRPIEVWLNFEKSRWSHLPFGYALPF
jgi:hypothetical protein